MVNQNESYNYEQLAKKKRLKSYLKAGSILRSTCVLNVQNQHNLKQMMQTVIKSKINKNSQDHYFVEKKGQHPEKNQRIKKHSVNKRMGQPPRLHCDGAIIRKKLIIRSSVYL